MHALNNYLIILCALAFIAYGVSCVWTSRMVLEFERYRLATFRKLTGYLQLLGALGLLIGLYAPAIGLAAASGLSLQMLLGVGVRIKIKDSLLQALPASSFMLLNAYLAFVFIGRL